MSLARWSWGPESPPDQVKYKFASIGKDCVIWPGAKIIGAERISLGNSVMIDDFAFLNIKKGLALHDFAHIAAFASITGGEYCAIGSFTSLSWGARIFTSTEHMAGLFSPLVPPALRVVVQKPVWIRKHVLVGANSVVLPGAIIEEGAMIGASSMVRQNEVVGPWEVWAGVPARYFYTRPREPVMDNERELRERYGQV